MFREESIEEKGDFFIACAGKFFGEEFVDVIKPHPEGSVSRSTSFRD